MAEVLKLFDITAYADRPNDRLSTGMKQRVGLARAVVHDPPVLILDEPTSGLDPIVSLAVEEAVVSLAKAGKCILLSTHLLDQAEDICQRRVGVIGAWPRSGGGDDSRTAEPARRRTIFATRSLPCSRSLSLRFEIIKTVFFKELRELLRDRRSLLVMFGLPLVLYPLLTVIMASVGQKKQEEFRQEQAQGGSGECRGRTATGEAD